VGRDGDTIIEFGVSTWRRKEMTASKEYVVRVVYKDGRIELHEYKNKKKALQDRDDFRKMETVVSAKMRLKPT